MEGLEEKITPVKFKATNDVFNKIKTYILSETDDKSLLPNNLSQEEKIEIDKKRAQLINDFEETKQKWNPIIKEEQRNAAIIIAKFKKLKINFLH